MSAYSTYPTKLQQLISGSYTNIAGVTKVQAPAITNKSIESTSFDSNGFPEKISGSFTDIANVSATIAVNASNFTQLYNYCVSGSMLPLKVAMPSGNSMIFNALLESFTPTGADATNRALQSVDISLAVSGSITTA
jgi:hypothetical protein